MSTFEALAAAKEAGIKLSLENDGRILVETATPPLPADVIAQLRAVRADLLHILEWRDAAQAALLSNRPSGAREEAWTVALRGLSRFVSGGWADQAALLGWSKTELYGLPPKWSRVDLCGAALLIGDRRVVAVTEASIVIETRSGSRLKFRRLGREHLA
jgi:hypothetical protein